MTRLSYTKAIDDVLRPAGFERRGKEWTRIRGEMEEQLDLQRSWIDGSVTVNVSAKNLETNRILKSIPCDPSGGTTVAGTSKISTSEGQWSGPAPSAL
jgi:hypothetical protein